MGGMTETSYNGRLHSIVGSESRGKLPAGPFWGGGVGGMGVKWLGAFKLPRFTTNTVVGWMPLWKLAEDSCLLFQNFHLLNTLLVPAVTDYDLKDLKFEV